MTCPACGAPVGTGARFCASCGHALRGRDDERRVVTVVFADLVGFTTLSEQLDPERVKMLVDRCFDRLAAEITAFGGRVDKIVGDAIVALFGAPVAHEDDAERAVRAALRLHEVVRAEAAESGQDLRLRIGINTGEVLVGAMRAAGSITAMGDVVNTASRLQSAAEPGQVLVGPSTHASTSTVISYRSLGALEVRGRAESVAAWAAIAPIAAPGARRRRDDVDLVGRDHEIALLRHAVHTSLVHERALLVLLVADVGMGKSRLADELTRWAVAEHRATTAEGRCLPYGEANVWWPVADALRGALGVDVGAAEPDARTSVDAAVRRVLSTPVGADDDGHDDAVARVTAGLLDLLGFEGAVEGVEPAAVRQETSRALGIYLNGLTTRRSVVFQVSDLHWGDDALLGLIDEVIAAVAHRPVVLIATARPDLLDRWQPSPGHHNALVLHLDPLDRVSSARLLDALAGRPIDPDVVAEVLDRSGGNPFFLQELVPLLDEPSGERVEALPATLRGLVAARLDALDAGERTLLQDASVVGQRGPVRGLWELVEHRSEARSATFTTELAALADQGLIDVEGDRWSFRSDLVREVAYQTVTKTDRAKTHHGIAHWLEEVYGDHRPRPSWLVDQLAHHYGAAVTLAAELGTLDRGRHDDLPARALRWTVAAAAGARRDQALPTAIARYDRAVVLSALDPSSTALDLAGLHVLRADAAVEAWDLAAAEESVDAIDDLLDPGEAPYRAAALAIRGRMAQRQGDPDRAIELLTAAEEMYGRLGRVAERAVTLRHLALVEIFVGRTAEAEVSAERSRAGFAAVEDLDGQGWATQHLAWIAFVQGDIARAEVRVREALDLFGRTNDDRGRSWAHGLLAWICFQGHQLDEAADLAARTLEEARATREPWATPMMTILTASIRLWTGHTDEAVELAAEAHRDFAAIADPYGTAQSSAVLGRSLLMAGRIEEGLAALDGIENGPMGAIGLIVAAQLGEPDRAERLTLGESMPLPHEMSVVRAVLDLQRGDVAGSRPFLDPARFPAGAGADLLAAGAMWCAAAGRDLPDDLVARLEGTDGATYLDRSTAHLAAALRAGASGDADAVDEHLDRSRALIEPTGDRVARHLHRMVAAAVDERLGADRPAPERVPGASWSVPGLAAPGWRRVVDLALAAGVPVRA